MRRALPSSASLRAIFAPDRRAIYARAAVRGRKLVATAVTLASPPLAATFIDPTHAATLVGATVLVGLLVVWAIWALYERDGDMRWEGVFAPSERVMPATPEAHELVVAVDEACRASGMAISELATIELLDEQPHSWLAYAAMASTSAGPCLQATTGLLAALLDRGPELRAILAHELAHARDQRRTRAIHRAVFLAEAALPVLAASALAPISPAAGAAAAVFAFAVVQPLRLVLTASVARRNEIRADAAARRAFSAEAFGLGLEIVSLYGKSALTMRARLEELEASVDPADAPRTVWLRETLAGPPPAGIRAMIAITDEFSERVGFPEMPKGRRSPEAWLLSHVHPSTEARIAGTA